MKPRWRWWLFCLALEAWWLWKWEWLSDLFAWCVTPEWLGVEPGDEKFWNDNEEVPF